MLASDTCEIKGNDSELVCPTIWRCIAPLNFINKKEKNHNTSQQQVLSSRWLEWKGPEERPQAGSSGSSTPGGESQYQPVVTDSGYSRN